MSSRLTPKASRVRSYLGWPLNLGALLYQLPPTAGSGAVIECNRPAHEGYPRAAPGRSGQRELVRESVNAAWRVAPGHH